MSIEDGKSEPIPKSTEYGKHYTEIAGRKLRIARNDLGEPSWESLVEVRDISNSLMPVPGFVGLTIEGSLMRGTKKSSLFFPSNINFAMLYDSSFPGFSFRLMRQTLQAAQRRNRLFFEQFKFDVAGWIMAYHESDLAELNGDWLEENASEPRRYVTTCLYHLCGTATGGRIDGYRRAAAERIAALPKQDRKIVLDSVLKLAMKYEDEGAEKAFGRMHIAAGEKAGFLSERRRLWQEWIEKVFDTKFE